MPLISTNVNERNTADGYSVKVESGRFYLRVATANNIAAAYSTAYTPPVKQWIHLACTFDSSLVRLYVNGSKVAEYPPAGPIWYGTAVLWFGLGFHSDFGGYSFFRGMLDEIRVWDRALDSAQINREMKMVLTNSEEHLVGYWNFDDTTHNDIVIDESTFHNHGLIWGDARFVTQTPF
jgi:hypothetical protein